MQSMWEKSAGWLYLDHASKKEGIRKLRVGTNLKQKFNEKDY